ncbi:MAG: 30S ribosomal protein S2 [Candidatus Levybacteria bacterium RIFCSPLOWO2_01_FULL_36_13]|nr:MAG: 30S ribosomal protein S2 [Candidatus Levybacteria bacterium RIFCSPHIGHO2_01_FULL_36_15b]OGH35383.1 MAG: 30S ribosomal protein S2 [Candidatus Levybacteria bacterium RIFCSPLOWO2_01_FULL_36_13]
MREITLEELLEAGCHFGHQVIRSNPKARDFVFEAREGIQIIDLVKTKEGLDQAAQFVRDLGKRGGKLLVVSTKKQAKQTVEELIKQKRAEINASKKTEGENLFYVTQRWIGGTLTNFTEVNKNLKKLDDIKKLLKSEEERAKYTKKELGLFDKERIRLESFYIGIEGLIKEPDALFIVDSHLEDLAVREANAREIETVAIVDTNADPFVIDYPIPANDDAVGSITLIVGQILDAFAEGLKDYKTEAEKLKEQEKAVKTEAKEKTPAKKEEAKTKPVKSKKEPSVRPTQDKKPKKEKK